MVKMIKTQRQMIIIIRHPEQNETTQTTPSDAVFSIHQIPFVIRTLLMQGFE
jgi:hypothetical protein